MSTIILGVDPGLDGALAFFNPDAGVLSFFWDMPTLTVLKMKRGLIGVKPGKSRLVDIHKLIADLAHLAGTVSKAFVENVHAMPKQGVTSSFGFGRSFGRIETVLASFSVPTIYVEPAVWKRAMGLRPGALKGDSILRAKQLAPWASHNITNEGRAEALLIALYGHAR